MDYNNIILLARERHAELIKDAQEQSRHIGNDHTVTVPNIFDRAISAVKAIFAKPASGSATGAMSRKLATK